MKVILIQTHIEWAQGEANRKNYEAKILAAGDADLFILPEMCSTGFCTHPKGIAEKEGETLSWMQDLACRKQAALCGSVATQTEGNYYNRFYFVYPDGTYTSYDKRHLFTYGGEHLEYTGGEQRVVVTYKGWRILLQVCYDLRFPVFARNTGDYDMILYVASWPASRMVAWDTLLRARAIENLCYVAGVNRVGDDPACHYAGGTALIDFKGCTLCEANPESEALLCGELDREALCAFREKFPALEDRDTFTLTR